MDDQGVADELYTAMTNKLAAVAAGLPRAAVTRADDGDLCLTVDGDRSAELFMMGSTEVFGLKLGTYYTVYQLAYGPDIDDKLENVDDFLHTMDLYLQGSYHEKVYESAAGTELHRDLYINNVHVAGSHGFPRAQFRRLRAKRNYTITP
ncbi:hypothetical protein GCM10029976_073470 [Kribbella albertanoniae]|uniref:Uncharacterized protein n=1 Tax=Kribbella albertanoniae TaxID=1266829 RepID=A0A4R4PAV9_9ACTN|nr:hypothetical protein [Kribbella albertanoniae]TDC19209.1 hypothetical protein E1261_34475 [Kribbella albertanoniae]